MCMCIHICKQALLVGIQSWIESGAACGINSEEKKIRYRTRPISDGI